LSSQNIRQKPTQYRKTANICRN